VTDAARNFSECVNRARYQGVTFILHRNGVPVARIVPESRTAKQAARDAAPAHEDQTSERQTPSLSPSPGPATNQASKPVRSLW
jgi:antitoxin (DNA-binding transcriptional repressor) of toxin-antitoxin stability system